VINTGTGGQAGGASKAFEEVRVGIILTVTPQVSADGFVFMDISVKSSTVEPPVPGTLLFTEISREANSRVSIRDGDTVVIGGIFREKRVSSRAGFPFLMDIPGLGWLFKRIIRDDAKEELMVFITPKILKEETLPRPAAEGIAPTQEGKN
jgi:type II secretory pathway component GspD/PulD (secretin)